jgi:hypothetical protein
VLTGCALGPAELQAGVEPRRDLLAFRQWDGKSGGLQRLARGEREWGHEVRARWRTEEHGVGPPRAGVSISGGSGECLRSSLFRASPPRSPPADDDQSFCADDMRVYRGRLDEMEEVLSMDECLHEFVSYQSVSLSDADFHKEGACPPRPPATSVCVLSRIGGVPPPPSNTTRYRPHS